MIRLLPWIGWGVAVLLFGLWQGARERIVEVRGECNASQLSAALEAEKLAADAQRKALEQRIEELASIAEREREAKRIAEEGRKAAEGRPDKVVEVVKEIIKEVPYGTLNGEASKACLKAQIPKEILNELQ